MTTSRMIDTEFQAFLNEIKSANEQIARAAQTLADRRPYTAEAEFAETLRRGSLQVVRYVERRGESPR